MSIKRNFIFSTVLTVSNYIFPFIVYPYVARVLGVDNIGICNFVDSIINYAMMISLMGISILGVREIAKAKGDRRRLDTAFTSLITICLGFTLLSTLLLVAATMLADELAPYRKLLLIGILKLWSNFFLIDWLYRGLEDFKYITMRTILVKTAYVVSVFVFIHAPADYVTYYLLMCLMYTVNAAFNCRRAVRLVGLRFSGASMRRMLRPFVALGVYLLLNSLYSTLNVLYLGLEHGDTQVGYYTTATKVFQIILAIYTAYSGVIMPRASALISQNKHDEFKALIMKSIDALILFAVPAVMFTVIFSKGITLLIAGGEYMGAVTPMAVVMPLIFIIGYEQILVVQVLTPLGNDRIILFNSIVGATVGVAGNLLLVGPLASLGAAAVWVSAEIAVMLSAQYFVMRKTGIHFPWRRLLVNVGAYLPCAGVCVAMVTLCDIDAIVLMFIGMAICGIYCLAVQRWVLKNPIFRQLTSKIPLLRS